ncbi:CidA/LrgA family protein [Oceanithermus sp.]
MNLALGFALLLGFYGLGEGLARLLPGLPLSGSLWGMVLLYLALASGLVREERVAGAARLVLRGLGLYFVPVGVGALAFEALLREQALAVGAALLFGTLITLAAAAGGARWRS